LYNKLNRNLKGGIFYDYGQCCGKGLSGAGHYDEGGAGEGSDGAGGAGGQRRRRLEDH